MMLTVDTEATKRTHIDGQEADGQKVVNPCCCSMPGGIHAEMRKRYVSPIEKCAKNDCRNHQDTMLAEQGMHNYPSVSCRNFV